MEIGRYRRDSQRLHQLHLPCRGIEEIVPTNDLRDALAGVVHHDGQLIRRLIAFGPDDEVPDCLCGVVSLRSGESVIEFHDACWGSESPVCVGTAGLEKRGHRCGTTRCRKDGFACTFLRCGKRTCRGVIDFSSTLDGRIHKSAGREHAHRLAIRLEVCTLHDRPFVPLQPERFKSPLQSVGHSRLHAGRIQIFDPEQDAPTPLFGECPVDQERASIPQMKRPGGRWRKSCPLHGMRSVRRIQEGALTGLGMLHVGLGAFAHAFTVHSL